MPYTKKSSKQFEEFTRLLKGYGLSATKLSKVLGCSYPTAKAKLDNPSRFTLEDLGAIHTKGHIDQATLKGAIMWH